MPREAMPTPHPEPEPPRIPKSDPPIKFSAGGMEVAVKGAQAVYALGLVACFILGGRVLPPVLDAADKLTVAMKETAGALAKVTAEVSEARAGVGRVEAAQREAQANIDKRLGQMESDLAGLRSDMRAACAGPKR